MKKRIEKLQQEMNAVGIGAALLLYSRDILYYAGTAQPCNLLIPADGDPTLFVRRAVEMVRKETHLSIQESGDLEAVKRTMESYSMKSGVLGVELDVIPAKIMEKIKETFRGFSITDISPIILKQRMYKEEEEITRIEDAASKFDIAHRTIMDVLRPGITELDVGAEVGASLRKAGVEGRIFSRRWDSIMTIDGMIASAENLYKISGQAITITGVGLGSSLPWGPSARRLEKGDILVIDLAINLQGYHGDVARTYTVGKSSKEQRKVFDSLLKLHEHLLEQVRPGTTADRLYRVSATMAKELGYGEFFMGYGRQQGQYLGHGIGLEIDEPPVIAPNESIQMKKGMVITIEPKFIIPRWGAVMLEDDLLITKNGCRRLSRVEQELFEVY